MQHGTCRSPPPPPPVPGHQIIEYKYVVIGEDGRTPTAWQSGGNSVLALLPDDAEVDVYDNWWVAGGRCCPCLLAAIHIPAVMGSALHSVTAACM